MPCLPVPSLPLPTVPEPFSLLPNLPTVPSLQADICCQSINLGTFVPPIPLPPLVLTGATALLTKAVQVVNNYVDSLPIDCPRN